VSVCSDKIYNIVSGDVPGVSIIIDSISVVVIIILTASNIYRHSPSSRCVTALNSIYRFL
jgi:hypothetical protein